MKARKLIVLLLTLVLIISLCPIGAFAATADSVKQYGKVDKNGYGGYLAFGDSIARGLGAAGGFVDDNQYQQWTSRIVDGCYPLAIAKAVGCDISDSLLVEEGNYWPVCYPSETITGVVDLLGIDNGYYDSEYVHANNNTGRYANQILPAFACPESVDNFDGITGTAGNIREIAKKASLISIGLGMGDTLNRPARLAQMCLEDESLSSTEQITAAVETALTELAEGYAVWYKSYPLLLKTLKEWNSNATIVLVSSINIVADVTITDEDLLPLGTAFAAVTATMNANLKQWAKEYDCIYVDVSNTESRGTQYEWSAGKFMEDFEIIGAHPAEEGYAYITRQILEALPTEEASNPQEVTSDITVDLGRYSNVSYVLLDGKPVNNYSMNGFELTVPCNSKLAKNLTIAVKNANGTIDVVTYQLAYHDDTGYNAYRIYGKNDATGTLIKTVKKIVTTSFSLFKNIANLFKF